MREREDTTPGEDTTPEQEKAARREHDQQNADRIQMNEAAIRTGESAIKAAILANGGAVIAVLAFVGNLAGRSGIDPKHLVGIAGSLNWFAWGVAAGVACLLLAYLTNLSQAQKLTSHIWTWKHPYWEKGKATDWFAWQRLLCQWLAIVMGAASLALFVLGIWHVRVAITGLADSL